MTSYLVHYNDVDISCLKNFEDLDKNTKLSKLLLIYCGFDFKEKKIICKICDYKNENYINLTIEILLKDHYVYNKSCSNCKRHFEFAGLKESFGKKRIYTTPRPTTIDACKKTFEGVEFTELDLNQLCENGFYRLNEETSLSTFLINIECFSCGYSTNVFRTRNFNINYKSPSEEHAEKSPNCRFNQKNKNFEFESMDKLRNVVKSLINNKSDKPFNRGYESEEARKESFRDWSLNFHSFISFVTAGFYYTGINDLVKCFYCNGAIKNWDPLDDAFEEHARWFPKCPFIRQIKGVEFIDNVRMRYKDMNSGFNDDSPFDYYDQVIGDPKLKNSLKFDYSCKSKKLKTTSRDVNARIELKNVRHLIEKIGFDETIIKKIIKEKLENSQEDFESPLELAKAYFDYKKQTFDYKNQVKRNYHLYFANLPIGFDEIQMKMLFKTKFKIEIKFVLLVPLVPFVSH